MQHPNNDDQQQGMAVLESLEPVQQQQQQQQPPQMGGQLPSLGLLEPVNQSVVGQQQQQQQHLVQHLVQAVAAQQQQPHLHQLQPSHAQLAGVQSADSVDGSGADANQQQQQQQQQQQHQQQQAAEQHHARVANNLLRPRPQIEGIVADGGGPIVQWLLDNYEIADGESLPRSTVYNHYQAHCRRVRIASVNAASFGKLIRSVFVGLKTRRLGTRGHSKYHYFGVRAKQHIQAELLQHSVEALAGAGCSRPGELSAGSQNSNQTSNGDNTSGHNSESESDSLNGSELARADPARPHKRLRRHHAGYALRRDASEGDAAVAGDQQQQQQQQQLDMAGATVAVLPNGYYTEIPSHQQHHQHLAHNPHLPQTFHMQHQHQHQHHQQQQPQQLHHLQAEQHQQHHHHQHHIHHNQNGFRRDLGELPAGATDALCEPADLRRYMGANWATLVDEHWPSNLWTAAGPPELADDLELLWAHFETSYRDRYKQMVERLSELKWHEVEPLWRDFWHPPVADATGAWSSSLRGADDMIAGGGNNADAQQQEPAGDRLEPGPEHQQRQHHHHQQQQQHAARNDCQLTFHNLYQLTSQSKMVERISQIDYQLYAALESFLLPDILSPIPAALAKQINLFAENIAVWMELAVKDYDPQFSAEKCKSARAFRNTLRRYTSLNLLATASRAIWDKRAALSQMSMDLSRVDFHDIEYQVSLMSHSYGDRRDTVSAGAPADTAPEAGSGSGTGGNLAAASSTNGSGPITKGAAEAAAMSAVPPANAGAADDATSTSGCATQIARDPAHETLTTAASTNGGGGAAQTSAANQQTSNENETPTTENQQASTATTTINESNLQQQQTLSTLGNQVAQTTQSRPAPHHHQHLCSMQPGQLIQNFLHLFEDPYPANSWPDWCRNLVESRVCGISSEEARNFVLKWNFYISLIMKDLILRQAPSFVSFQLIRLLFDEYIFYLVVTRLAQAQHKTPGQLAAVVCSGTD